MLRFEVSASLIVRTCTSTVSTVSTAAVGRVYGVESGTPGNRLLSV